MARTALLVGAGLAAPAAATAWWLRGPDGALTALGAVALVVGTFALTGWSLDRAGRHGLGALQAVAIGGFGLRLSLYAAGIVLLADVPAIDGHALAVATAVSLVVLLAFEVRLLTTRPELWWVEPQAAGPDDVLHGKDRA